MVDWIPAFCCPAYEYMEVLARAALKSATLGGGGIGLTVNCRRFWGFLQCRFWVAANPGVGLSGSWTEELRVIKVGVVMGF
jgi:hypothetical protein